MVLREYLIIFPRRHLAPTWTYIKAHFTVIYALIKIYKTCNPWDSRYFIWEQISIENVFHQHSRQSTKKTNSIPFFFTPQFQLGNHTGYCIEKIPLHLILDFICIGKTPHTHTHTHTQSTKIISHINKKNKCYVLTKLFQ